MSWIGTILLDDCVFNRLSGLLYELAPRRIDVGVDDFTDRGRTTGSQVAEAEAGDTVFVAESIDLEVFQRDFIEMLDR